MLCVKKFEADALHNKSMITVCRFDVRLKPAVFYSNIFVCRSVSYTLDNTLSNRLLGQQLVGNYEDRYLLRATSRCFRGISIGFVSNYRVRAAAKIASCATDLMAKVQHKHSLKIIPNRLSFRTIPLLSASIDTY